MSNWLCVFTTICIAGGILIYAVRWLYVFLIRKALL